jgi:hypothetical protein
LLLLLLLLLMLLLLLLLLLESSSCVSKAEGDRYYVRGRVYADAPAPGFTADKGGTFTRMGRG